MEKKNCFENLCTYARYRSENNYSKIDRLDYEEVIKLMKTKNYVFSDSVLRVRKKIHLKSQSIDDWKTHCPDSKVLIDTKNWMEFMENPYYLSGKYSQDSSFSVSLRNPKSDEGKEL